MRWRVFLPCAAGVEALLCDEVARLLPGCVAQSRRGAAAGSAIVNATLAGDLGWRGARLALTLANLFDRHWADPGGAPDRQPLVVQDGRSWRLQLSMAH